MELSEQVTNLELSKKLKELGVNQDSFLYWVCTENANYILETDDEAKHYSFKWSAFSVAELGEMLNWKALMAFGIPDDAWNAVKNYDTEANTRAQMLIYLIENNLLKL